MGIKTLHKIEYARKGISYTGPESLEWHTKHYLKTEDGKPYSDLHKAMRNYGIDWFTSTTAEVKYRGGQTYERTPEWRDYQRKIQKAIADSKPSTKGRPYYKTRTKEWPNEKKWKIINSEGIHYVSNFRKWCRQRGYPWSKAKGYFRRQKFPWRDIELIVIDK